LISFARRLWNALKPPPAVRRWRLTPRQKRLLIAAGSFLVAIAIAGSVWSYIASEPQRAQAQFEQGFRRMTPGNYRDAVRSFDRAIEIWRHMPQAYYQRGIAHHFLGDADAALEDFTLAIAENPRLGAAYTERGTILRERGDLDRALQEFTRAVAVDPSANSLYQRGQTYALQGQPQKALEDFDRAVAELRDAPYLYSARAEVKRSLGDLAGSKADLDLAVQNQYRGLSPAWVDLPLPPNTPEEASADQRKEASPEKPVQVKRRVATPKQ
jgi:tetratricopeptide (TPR) repeat protein